MDYSIGRSGSPLYDAIREIMAGTWPEDEYDVAESPLSYGDYKSQVFFDVDRPVASVGGAYGTSDTDFESLESDESRWSQDADDTMATEVDIGTPESNTNSKIVAVVEGEMLRELFGEIGEGKEEEKMQPKEEEKNEGIEKVREKRVKTNSWPTISTESSEIPREKILEGPEEAIGSEIELTIATRAESELGEIEEIFRAEITAEVNNAFNGRTDDEIKTGNPTAAKAEQAAAEIIGSTPPGLVIPPVSTDEITPIVDDFIEPPPIPSRSPSRPGTSMANRKTSNGTPMAFAPHHKCDSSLSLPPATSSIFEEPIKPATTTATSIEASEKGPLSSPLPPSPPSPKETEGSDVKEPLKKKERKRTRFLRSRRLESLFKRLKFGEPRAQKPSGSKRPRTTSITSIIKW